MASFNDRNASSRDTVYRKPKAKAVASAPKKVAPKASVARASAPKARPAASVPTPTKRPSPNTASRSPAPTVNIPVGSNSNLKAPVKPPSNFAKGPDAAPKKRFSLLKAMRQDTGKYVR